MALSLIVVDQRILAALIGLGCAVLIVLFSTFSKWRDFPEARRAGLVLALTVLMIVGISFVPTNWLDDRWLIVALVYMLFLSFIASIARLLERQHNISFHVRRQLVILTSLLGVILAITTSIYVYSRLPLLGPASSLPRTLRVQLQCHMAFKNNEWTLVSALDTKPAGNNFTSSDQNSVLQRQEGIKALEHDLKSHGWKVDVEDGGTNLLSIRTTTFTEESGGWKLSHTRSPIPLLESVVTLQEGSELILDAPKGLVVETFPPIKSNVSKATEDGQVRLEIPLKRYAVDEAPYLNLTTSSQTLWGKVGNSLKRFFSRAINWIVTVLLGALAIVITGWLTGIFGKKKKDTKIEGLAAGASKSQHEQ